MKEGSVYELDGRVPLKKALPLGIQHVLAMFLGNVSPLLIVCGLLDIALDTVSYTHLRIEPVMSLPPLVMTRMRPSGALP